MRQLVMQNLKNKHCEKSEQEREVERNRDRLCRNGEGLGLIPIRNFESKSADNGGPQMRLFVIRSLKD